MWWEHTGDRGRRRAVSQARRVGGVAGASAPWMNLHWKGQGGPREKVNLAGDAGTTVLVWWPGTAVVGLTASGGLWG